MFFFGIFGVNSKSKEIMDINNVTCKQCGRFGVYRLIKQFSYFHVFFIPIFKWGEQYFLISRCCKSVFKISEAMAKGFEEGKIYNINESEMEYLYGEEKHYLDECPHCKRDIDRSFDYCPYCGRKI